LTTQTVDDLRSVLDQIPLNEISLHFDGGPTAPILLVGLEEIASERDIDDLRGSVGYDPIAALSTGTIRDAEAAFALVDDLVSEAPSSVRSLTVDLRPYHDAGASAVQELAYGLGALSDTLARLLENGHGLSTLLSRLQFTTAVSTSYFVEIAKLRALRLLVPQVVNAFAAAAEADAALRPTDLFVQAETSRRTETIYDPYVNMLRATTEGMAAVIGGCDVLSVRPYDAALRAEDNFGTRIARNVQLILREEAHFDAVADPGAGAYYLEAATDRLAERAWDTFQDLEANGGLLAGLRDGHVQQQIAEMREERQSEVDTRKRVLVGTNHYPALDETRRGDLDEPPSFSSPTDSIALDAPSLNGLRTALSDGHSISDLLSTLSEGPTTIEPLPRLRVSEAIEKIRLRTERHAEETGHTPTVFLAPLGPAKMRSARANFARNVLGVAGFDVVEPLRFDAPDDAAEAAAEADADIVVLCSADSEYPDLAPALRSALNDRGLSPLLVVAGNPDTIDADLPADDFIHQGNLLREKLASLQSRLGIPTDDAQTNG
jgi:methylmalonyl-CoA mutase